MLIYQVVKEKLYNQDIGRYISYGITIYDYTNCNYHKLKTISDISTNEELVTKLAAMCTRGQLSPIHFMDVIEDFIE